MTSQNKNRCVKLRGLPFEAKEQTIIDFFAGFSVSESDVVIERQNGKATGYALVFLQNQSECMRAKEQLNKRMIGKRYIDVMFVELNM